MLVPWLPFNKFESLNRKKEEKNLTNWFYGHDQGLVAPFL
jgi:hypothetical protein